MPEECFLRYLLKFDLKESKTLSSIYTGILNNLSFEADYALWDGISLLCCNLKSLFCCGVSPRCPGPVAFQPFPKKSLVSLCSHRLLLLVYFSSFFLLFLMWMLKGKRRYFFIISKFDRSFTMKPFLLSRWLLSSSLRSSNM